MFYSEVCRILSRYLLCLAGILLIPLGISILYEYKLEPVALPPVSATSAFIKTIGISLLLALVMFIGGRKKKDNTLHRKEGILLVVIIWFLTAAVCSLPFVFTKVFSNPIDAYFEAMSGLTTTGATVIQAKTYDPSTGQEIASAVTNTLSPNSVYTFYGTVAPMKDLNTGSILYTGIEALGKPLLFWRSFLQWVGGIGIVVLFITVLPSLSLGGKFLYESEVAGPIKERLFPRIKETGTLFLKIYAALTLALVLLLLLTNFKMPLFDAVTLSLSTISTGGFTIYNNGLEPFSNLITKSLIMLFMVLGSVNFTLYFYFLKGKTARLKDPELFYYLITLTLGSLFITFNLWEFGDSGISFGKTLLQGMFQAISAQTSTGFSIVNYDLWPLSCQFLLLVLMLIGGMSGSTAGGIKMVRCIILCKAVGYKIESFFRPSVVRVLKIGSKEISDKTLMNVFVFFGITIFLIGLGVYLLLLDNLDIFTSIGVISTVLSNAGLCFGGIGSTESLGYLSNFSKVIAILWMVLGRLEFFSLLVLLAPSFWKNE